MPYRALRPYQNATGPNPTNLNPYLLYYFFPDNSGNTDKSENLKILANNLGYSADYRNLLESLSDRQEHCLRHYEALNYIVFKRSIALLNHAMPGQGIPSSFENGLSLHSVYGFPYFPSSSVKGIVKSWIQSNQCFGDETENILDYLFGNPDRQGKIIFFDVFPSSQNIGKMFAVDILNPHFSEYYQNGAFPTDDQTPIPITFLAIRKDTEFVFRWTLSSVPQNYSDEPDAFTQKCNDIFIEALQYQGIGAKTSLGYGMFK